MNHSQMGNCNGSCIDPGYYGPISRTCIQSGSIGNWSTISGSCEGILFSDFLIIKLSFP